MARRPTANENAAVETRLRQADTQGKQPARIDLDGYSNLAALGPLSCTPEMRATAREKLVRWGDTDLIEILGL